MCQDPLLLVCSERTAGAPSRRWRAFFCSLRGIDALHVLLLLIVSRCNGELKGTRDAEKRKAAQHVVAALDASAFSLILAPFLKLIRDLRCNLSLNH